MIGTWIPALYQPWKYPDKTHVNPNPRPAGGGGLNTPLRFFEDSEKMAARSAAVFLIPYQTLILHFFQKFGYLTSENFVPRSSRVRSPGQIKWPYLLKSLWYYSSYNSWTTNIKLSGYHRTANSYKTYVSDLLFRWPKVRSILCPPHYKAMGEKSNPSFKHQIRWFLLRIGLK